MKRMARRARGEFRRPDACGSDIDVREDPASAFEQHRPAVICQSWQKVALHALRSGRRPDHPRVQPPVRMRESGRHELRRLGSTFRMTERTGCKSRPPAPTGFATHSAQRSCHHQMLKQSATLSDAHSAMLVGCSRQALLGGPGMLQLEHPCHGIVPSMKLITAMWRWAGSQACHRHVRQWSTRSR